jgi:hypothetical protein
MFPVTPINPADVNTLFTQSELCGFCREKFWEDTAEIIRTKCNHFFHLPCLKTWFGYGKVHCILCGEQLAKKKCWGDVHRLYQITKWTMGMGVSAAVIGVCQLRQPFGHPLLMAGTLLMLGTYCIVKFRVLPLARAEPRMR